MSEQLELKTPANTSLPLITERSLVNQIMEARLNTRIFPRGEIIMPCVPAFLENYVQRLEKLFDSLGKRFTPEEMTHLRGILEPKLQQGFALSPHSNIVFRYEPNKPPALGISYNVGVATSSVADQYNSWVETREPPLFGSHPDAKVMDVAAKIEGSPAKVKILDVGAGTGRNTLPLARLGYKLEVLELTPAFVEQLQKAAEEENLTVKAMQGDILDPLVRLRPSNYQLVICVEVVASHFRDADQLRLLLAKMCDYLCKGGLFLFSAFIAVDGYDPDQIVREMSQIVWSTIFTNAELNSALEDLPLELISNESVFDYERDRLPQEAWPPTGWFNNWAKGRDLFPIENGEPPMELRWILCKRV
ncbi:class I SAM-dependent methyltransferase [Microcoleus sp. FACHB-831]|uniref:class I SAM-dependent methyltransferase n=1 Tax=Microcoleus sp. FACHB-831 TaxID=2692827 RepID=UPI0016865301|nr:class I SAM-dependent methyltransferase [Microcoleus sp. FACHB-831]MBD1919803.1 class I SAM-dependent methyltransferase [Microcoleus sp. FACHB-831]